MIFKKTYGNRIDQNSEINNKQTKNLLIEIYWKFVLAKKVQFYVNQKFQSRAYIILMQHTQPKLSSRYATTII